eukprot:13989186-Alexandrium_andersonii.AAC.1
MPVAQALTKRSLRVILFGVGDFISDAAEVQLFGRTGPSARCLRLARSAKEPVIFRYHHKVRATRGRACPARRETDYFEARVGAK